MRLALPCWLRPPRVALLVCLLAQSIACASDLSLASRRSDFELLIALVDAEYAYTDAGIPCWSELRERYAARVDDATTPDAWSRVVEDVIDELHDFHAEVAPGSSNARWHVPTSADIWAEWQGPRAIVRAVRHGSDAQRAKVRAGDEVVRVDGEAVGPAADANLSCSAARRDPAARRWALLALLAGRLDAPRTLTLRAPSGTLREVVLPAWRRIDRPAEPVSAERMSAGIALIRINNALGRQDTVAAFDTALANVREVPALILDLRDVPSGGNSGVALGIMGRLVAQRLPYQRHRIPVYGARDVERNWVEEVAPRGPFSYSGRLVVLVDPWTASMGEGIAIGLDGMRRGTVIGMPMAALAGGVEHRSLPATGLQIRLPVEQIFHVDGTPRHRWKPPIEVAPDPDDRDAILERALAWLRAPR